MQDSVYFIGNDVQQRVLRMPDAIAALERVYGEWDAGRAMIRPKTNMYVYNPDDDNRYGFSTMEGGGQDLGLVAIRIKSDVQPNHRQVTEVSAEAEPAHELVPRVADLRTVGETVQVLHPEYVEILGRFADDVVLDVLRQRPRLVAHPRLCSRQPDHRAVDHAERSSFPRGRLRNRNRQG